MPNTTVPVADTGLPDKDEDAHCREFDHFQSLFADWLEARAKCLRTDPERTDEQREAMNGREDELALQIMATPVPVQWMIFQKIQVLEHAMSNDSGDFSSNWYDNREVMMLGCIKADLMRFLAGANV
jgi:hypothetical protein